ncbi:MAG: hypothetical protein M3Y53_07395 [Thermoproteota archaeon]|nr:hypothetical protein [Thermoproteota archaeon]
MDDIHKEEIGKEESVEKDINVQNQSVSRKKSGHLLKSLAPGVITGAYGGIHTPCSSEHMQPLYHE